jgi:hypothetical protein
MKERLQSGFGLRHGHARFHSSEHVHPAASAILQAVKFGELRAQLRFHHDGDANLRRRAGIGAVKPARLTPTMVSGYPSTSSFLPITSRLPPKRLCQ